MEIKRGDENSSSVSASIGCDMSKSGICDCYIQVRSKRNVNCPIVSIKTHLLGLEKRALDSNNRQSLFLMADGGCAGRVAGGARGN